jgi:hypothetical protein
MSDSNIDVCKVWEEIDNVLGVFINETIKRDIDSLVDTAYHLTDLIGLILGNKSGTRNCSIEWKQDKRVKPKVDIDELINYAERALAYHEEDDEDSCEDYLSLCYDLLKPHFDAQSHIDSDDIDTD